MEPLSDGAAISGLRLASNSVMKHRVELFPLAVTFSVVVLLSRGQAQTHAVKKPEAVVRAVAIYEWTGDASKPTASRVVPVSLFINKQLQDAGIYLAQPVPFALGTGTVYEVQKGGVPAGTVDLAYERHLSSGETQEIEDGWMGYGVLQPRQEQPELAAKQRGPLPKLVVSGGKPGAPNTADPKLEEARGEQQGTEARNSGGPTLHRAPGSSSGDASDRTSSNKPEDSTDTDNDAERPTLKRRTPAEIKANQKKKDEAKVTGIGNLNDDPDRPVLHRGSAKPKNEEEEIPPLRGLPADMHQMVAVSDAKEHDEHNYVRPWESESERLSVLATMQGFARAKLIDSKGAVPQTTPSSAPVAKAPPAAATHAASTRTSATRAHKAAPHPATSAAAPSLPLTDEGLMGYTLSYGGAPTYVYQATSPGSGGNKRYVTVVAQQEPITGLKLALASVTDSSHLDRTPWMRLVDVVDADASNRASLLMELRAEHTRQFGLYRVIGAKADLVFLTGTTE